MTSNNLNADEILQQSSHKRAFIQYGGPKPDAPLSYAGQDAQYLAITGVSNPESGGIDPIWVPDPSRPRQWRLVGRSITPPDLPAGDVVFREKHGAISRALLKSCPFNLYEVSGACKDLSDFLGGWTDYVQVYEKARITDKDLGDRTSFDSDDPVEDTLSATFEYIYPIGSLSFGESAAPEISREVVDAVFGGGQPCDDCDWGDQRLYALTSPSGAGSPGLPAEVIYTVDGGATWHQVNVDGLGATEAVYAIDIVNTYLVVIGTGAYYYAEINVKTGVPGTFTKVTTGFVALHNPIDLLVLSPREVIIVGAGGYIYKSTSIPSGVSVLNEGNATTEDLKRIHGSGNTIVAVGANGAVIKSVNRGKTFASVTTSPEAAATIQAIAVLDNDRYWVGTSTGNVYWTDDGGETWTELDLPGLGSGAVHDIVFATQSVGYISHASATPAARLYCTWDGGADWTYGQYRILNWPTFDRATRIALPATDDPGYRSNTIALAGLAGDGTDGVLYLGVASKI